MVYTKNINNKMSVILNIMPINMKFDFSQIFFISSIID